MRYSDEFLIQVMESVLADSEEMQEFVFESLSYEQLEDFYLSEEIAGTFNQQFVESVQLERSEMLSEATSGKPKDSGAAMQLQKISGELSKNITSLNKAISVHKADPSKVARLQAQKAKLEKLQSEIGEALKNRRSGPAIFFKVFFTVLRIAVGMAGLVTFILGGALAAAGIAMGTGHGEVAGKILSGISGGGDLAASGLKAVGAEGAAEKVNAAFGQGLSAAHDASSKLQAAVASKLQAHQMTSGLGDKLAGADKLTTTMNVAGGAAMLAGVVAGGIVKLLGYIERVTDSALAKDPATVNPKQVQALLSQGNSLASSVSQEIKAAKAKA